MQTNNELNVPRCSPDCKNLPKWASHGCEEGYNDNRANGKRFPVYSLLKLPVPSYPKQM